MDTPSTTNENNNPSTFTQILEFLRNPENKTALSFFKSFVRIISPHPGWKLIGDVTIALLCIGSVIYCAKCGFIEQSNVQSLLALIIGAVVGSRFKGN